MVNWYFIKDMKTGLFISKINFEKGSFSMSKETPKSFYSIQLAKNAIGWLRDYLGIDEDEAEYVMIDRVSGKVVE